MSTDITERRCAFYAAIGRELTIYRVDVGDKALVRTGSVLLPEQVQYAWQHPLEPFFYVASSSGYVSSREHTTAMPSGTHCLNAFRVDEIGMLHALGAPVGLPARPVHVTVDRTGGHVLAAYPNPAGISVFRLNGDGTIGDAVPQSPELDVGNYPHQVMVTPRNQAVILVTRGTDAQHGRPEDPGALKVFGYSAGVLTNRASIALNGGYGYGPRHLDFHPTRPWVYVSFERQNELHLYDLLDDGSLSARPRCVRSTLADRANEKRGQGAGPIHVHPDGRNVYVANRSGAKPDAKGRRIFRGGEDTIAVFAIDGETGEPRFLQTAELHGFHPRTFAIEPGGRMLMSSAQIAMLVGNGDRLEPVPAGISTFDIGGDGRLQFVRRYPLDASGNGIWWSGVVTL